MVVNNSIDIIFVKKNYFGIIRFWKLFKRGL